MCPNCRAFVTTNDKVCPYCEVPIGPRAVDRRNPGEIMGGFIPQARFTTIMILLINTALFLAGLSEPAVGAVAAGRQPSGAHDARPMVASDHGRLSAWRHPAHSDEFVGAVRSGRGSGTAVRHQPPDRFLLRVHDNRVLDQLSSWACTCSVGSSAGIFGLIGAMLAFGVTDRSSLGSMIKALYMRWVIYGLVLSFLPGVDFWAHIGGSRAVSSPAGWPARRARA